MGERLAIVGKWTRHQSFGQQFEAEFLERLMPETVSEILAFLSSRAVKGIGPKMAEKIVSRFGEQSLNVLEQEPMQLTQIPGISEKKAQEMSESFQRQSGIRRLIEFLTIYHDALRQLAARHPTLCSGAEGDGHMSALCFHQVPDAAAFAARMNREFCVDISAQTYKANCRPVALTKLPLLVTEPMVGKLIAWMEQAACGCCAALLEEGMTSVGTELSMRHTAASL